MLSDGLKWMRLDDPEQGEIALLVPVPHDDDPWGALAPLRGTLWGDLITVVPGSVMSDALHGWATGLMRVIGRDPRYLQQRVPDQDGWCALHGECIFSKIHCRPGPLLPDCYESPHDDPEVAFLAAVVARSWREGRYVVVVDGPEWSLS